MLSIIVAIYNVEKYVKKTIKSLLEQTYQDIEILLVDDGSTDASGKLCDVYAEKDNRIQVIHKENGGLSDARNVGLQMSKGEYVAFVDGDDYLHPQMYEVLMQQMLAHDADMSLCSFQTVMEDETVAYEQSEAKEVQVFTGTEMYHYFDRLEMTVAWNKVYKKSLFDGISYPNGRLHEDEYVVHRLAGASKRIVFTEGKLYYYVVRGGSITNRLNMQRIDDMRAALEDRVAFFKEQNEESLSQETADRLINSLIMFDKQAQDNKDENRKQILANVKQTIKALLEKETFCCTVEGKRQARLFLCQPNLCFAYRWWKDISYRGIDKLKRILKMK